MTAVAAIALTASLRYMALPALAGSAKADPDVQVLALGFRFLPGEDSLTVAGPKPPELRITRGTKLLFVNKDVQAHTLTADGCRPGPGYQEPSAGPLQPLSDAFDGKVGPAVFGQEALPSPAGPCWFDSRNGNPNGFTNGLSPTSVTGNRVEVDTSRLPLGAYRFHCLIHDFMQGTLHVTGLRHSR